jgi:hypothetical protein
VRGTVKEEATGQVVATRDYPAAASLVVELDGNLMQYGRPYLATVALVDAATGGVAYTYPAYRVSRAAAAARQSMNISVDAKNRVLLKGQPRFVLGVYDSGGGYSAADAYWEDSLWSPTGSRRLDGLAINFYLNYWMGQASADAMKALMTNLQGRGITYLQTGNCFDRWPADGNFLINSSDAYVGDIGAHAGSGGYYTIDECRSELIPGAFDQYVRLRSLDPDSMTFAALLGNHDIVFWRDAADVLASDPYPMFGAEPAGGYNHKQVADWTARTREAVKNARPFMTVLQFFKFTSLGRWPTRQEMRNHAYMAVVEGAKGLWWWAVGNGAGALATVCSDWCAERTAHMNDLKAVVGELAALEPVLLADDAPSALAANTNPAAIRTMVKVVGGRGYVFAYNQTNQSVSTTFTWNTAPGTVAVNAEGRSLPVSGSTFSDTFGPYQAHVYVVGNGGTAGGGGSGGTDPAGPLTVGFTNPPAGATVGGTTTVTMTAVGGSGYVYNLAVGNANVYTGANNSFSWNTSMVADGSHTLTATVRDAAGKTGTGTRTVTVSNASTPPGGDLAVIFTSPSDGATVSGSVAVNVWVEGQSGSSNTFALSVDGQSAGTMTTSGTHAWFVWDTKKVGDGAHTLTATVRDAAGKTGTASRSVKTSNGLSGPAPSPLSASITSPAAGATVGGTTTVGMTASGAAAGTTTFTLAVDGQVVSSQAVSGTTASYAWNTTAATNGGHTLSLTVRDAAGATAMATRSVTVSNATTSPPTGGLRVIFTSPSEGATVKGGVAVNVWVEAQSGSSNTFALTADGQNVGSMTTSGTHAWFVWDTTKVADGAHTLTATVKDATGKTGTASRSVRTSNGVTSPIAGLSVSITSPAQGATVRGGTTVAMSASGGTGYSYRLAVDGRTVFTGTRSFFPWNTTQVADGPHTLTATVTDATGKTGTATRTVTVANSAASPRPLKVVFTSPAAGALVGRDVTVNVWVEGASGSSNAFTLTVDGRVLGTQTVSGAHVWFVWPTRGLTNGIHTLAATVKDATGTTGSASLPVRVSN